MTIQEKKQWVKEYVGKSFVRGLSIKGYVATVVVKNEDGTEREIKVSLPNPNIGKYKE